jgi:hypothetical protein
MSLQWSAADSHPVVDYLSQGNRDNLALHLLPVACDRSYVARSCRAKMLRKETWHMATGDSHSPNDITISHFPPLRSR